MDNTGNPRRIMEFWKEDTDGTIVAASAHGLYHLDPVASLVWQMCDGEHTVEEIVSAICKLFSGTEEETVSRDVGALLDCWKRDKLIVKSYDSLHPLVDEEELPVWVPRG